MVCCEVNEEYLEDGELKLSSVLGQRFGGVVGPLLGEELELLPGNFSIFTGQVEYCAVVMAAAETREIV